MKQIAFWDCDRNAEEQRYESRDEALSGFLDERPPDEWPETLEVHGWARVSVPWPSAGDCAVRLMAPIDEKFGDPNGEPYYPSAAVIVAAEALLDVLRAEYVPWACEYAVTETVDVRAWLDERLDGGDVYEDAIGHRPPPEIEALAFALPGETLP